MRFLFTFAGGNGHFEPLLPVAQAAQRAGHSVAVAGQPAMGGAITGGGLEAFGIGTDLGTSSTILPLMAVSQEREDRALRDAYAGWIARERATALLALCAVWRPDLIMCDEVDFGAMVAAERAGVPHATVLVMASGSFVRRPLIEERLRTLRAEHGLPADAAGEMLDRDLILSPFPPSFRDPAFPLPAGARSFRSFVPGAGSADPFHDWAGYRPDRPTVYFTLGTIFNTECGDLIETVLRGLAELSINLVVTVGSRRDPTAFGPQPPQVRIERFIPQVSLLPHCRLVVSHGGSGSVTGALAHGLPLVVIPLGADQPNNAARVVATGTGRALDAMGVTPTSIAETVSAVLADLSYTENARRIATEIAALPDVEQVIPALEALAARRRELPFRQP